MPENPSGPWPLEIAQRSCSGLVVIALGIVAWRSKRAPGPSAWVGGATILFALMCAASATEPFFPPVYALLDRVAYGMAFFCWMILSLRRKSPADDAVVPLGFLFGSLLNLLELSGIPLPFASSRLSCVALSFAALVACAALSRSSCGTFPVAARRATAGVAGSALAMRYSTLVLGAVAFAFVFGTMTDLHGWMSTVDAYRSVQAANVCVAAIVSAAFLLYRKPFRPDAAVAIVLPAFAAALLSTPAEEESIPFSRLAIMTGYLAYWAIAWVFVVREHERLGVGGLPVIALVSGSMLIFVQIGRMAAARAFEGGSVDPGLLTSIALVLFWLLVLLAIGAYWIARNKAVERDLAELSVIEASPADRDSFASALLEEEGEQDDARRSQERGEGLNVVVVDKLALQARALSHRIGLSARETEVMVEFIRGRSAASIAEKLFISRNTVKTHLRRIYEKAGIHSRQELLDMLEEEVSDDGSAKSRVMRG